MATGDYSFTYNTYLKENVWYAYNSLYVFNCDQISDPSLTKLYPSVNDNVYIFSGTYSSTSTTYTFNSYTLWGVVIAISNNGDRITCRRNSDSSEYVLVRAKYDGTLRAWYNSLGDQRVYTQTTTPEELEGFYDENGTVYRGYDFTVTNGTNYWTSCKITQSTSSKIVINGNEKA